MPSAARYAAQKAAAAEAGTTPYKARIARAIANGATSRAIAEGHGRRAKRAAARRKTRGGTTRKFRDLTVGGETRGRITSTRSRAKLRDEMRKAAKAGQRVRLRVTVQKADGTYRTVELDGGGGQTDLVQNGAESGEGRGQGGGGGGGGGGSAIPGDVQITRFDPGALGGAQGFDPTELVEYLDEYDDWYDGLADLADVEVS